MNAALRPATSADAPRVASLLIDTCAAFMPYAPAAHTEAEIRDWVRTHLVPSGGVTVAEINGTLVAAMAVEQSEALSWITQMAVDPALVGQGIGSLLLSHAMRTLPLPIRLYTFQANVGARRFYAYDAYFLQCSLEGNCPLLTLDGGMKRVARQLGITLVE